MTQLADFLNVRKQVHWMVEETGAHTILLAANAPKSLTEQTWVLPKSRYGKPRVVSGTADVQSDADDWRVTARDCKRLQVEFGEK